MSTNPAVTGRLGSFVLHSRYDSRALTENARAAFLSKFERQVVEAAEAAGEVLSRAEIAKRTEFARRAHMLSLAIRSAKARAARKRKAS